MNVELFTDGTWKNTKLMVDGAKEKFIKSIDITIAGEWKASIVVEQPLSGTIPYGSLVTITGVRVASKKYPSAIVEYDNVIIHEAV